jgi:NHLM bacteriocin system ABC transporter ATP-binding protein
MPDTSVPSSELQTEKPAYKPVDLATLVGFKVTTARTHLYICRQDADGAPGERHFLCTLPAGALITPMSLNGFIFIATPVDEQEDWGHEAVSPNALTRWQAALGTAPFLDIGGVDVRLAKPGGTTQVEAGTLLSTDVPLWAVAEHAVFSVAAATGVVSGEAPAEELLAAAPVGDGWIVRVMEATAVRLVTPDTLLAADGRESVQRVADRWAELAVVWLASVEEQEHRLEAASRTSNEDAFSKALVHIAQSAEGRAPDLHELSAVEEPLIPVLNVLEKELGIEIVAPPERQAGQSLVDRLDRISQASRFHYRAVTLDGRWWVEEGVPLLAVRKDGTPVALLPARGKYTAVDPTNGTRTPLSESGAKEFQPRAYQLYAKFPDELDWRTIATFAWTSARQTIWWMLGSSLAVALLGLIVPLVTGVIVSRAIPSGRIDLLAEMVLILVAVAVSTALFNIIEGFATTRFSLLIDLRLQPALWDRIMSLPPRFFRQYEVGDLVFRALGFKTIANTLSSTAISAVLTGVMAVTSFAIMALADLPLTVFAVFYSIASVALIILLARAQLYWQRQVYHQRGRVKTLVLQILTGIPKLRVAAAEERAFARWGNTYAAQRGRQTRASIVSNITTTLLAVLPILGYIGVFIIAGAQVGTLDVAAFIVFFAAFGQFLNAMLGLSQSITQTLIVVPLYDRVKPILDAAPEVDETRQNPGELSGAITVRNVTFRYHDDGPDVLKDVSFDVEPGQFVAFVGPSGAGKSTTLRLLLGFETPQDGAVFYDGKDLAHLDLLQLRRQIGTVLQNIGLVPGSIYENVAGASLVSREQVMEALEMAGLVEEIKALPMGLNTLISEGGRNLSGGQRQRLMIARVLVHNPRIIFFDEATSALDNRTQATVTASLEHFRTTRVVIAHRLSTIRRADKILVIDKGRIVQQGTFEELMKQDGLFRRLAERQLA